MNISQRIKLLRLLNGLTQESLAGLANVSRPALVNYEKNEYDPIDSVVIRLANIFDVEPGYIRYGSPIVSGCVWHLQTPRHSVRRLALLADLQQLLPEFIYENQFTCLAPYTLSSSTSLLLFGRSGRHDCLLYADSALTDFSQEMFRNLKSLTILGHIQGDESELKTDNLESILAKLAEGGVDIDSAALLGSYRKRMADSDSATLLEETICLLRKCGRPEVLREIRDRLLS